MKKTLITLFITLIFTNSVFAISKTNEEGAFNACMEGASKSGKNKKLQIEYCTCIVDYVDERYSDDQFLELQNGPEEKFDDVMNAMANTCLNSKELIDLDKKINKAELVKNLSLECYGTGSKGSTMSKFDQKTGISSQTHYTDRSNSSVNVSIDKEKSWIQIPTHLLPPMKIKKPNNKYNIYNLKISDDSITGKFKLNIMNRPSLTLDRYSGVLSFKGPMVSFTGKCKKVDRTEKKF